MSYAPWHRPPPSPARTRHLADPLRSRSARATVVRLPQLDGDQGQGADHLRHEHDHRKFLEDVFNLVEPADVKWIYLSHDDVDHTGNLSDGRARMQRSCAVGQCSNATATFEFPMQVRWVNDGESFEAYDRTLRAIRPPVWDSPTTRGLFDQSTGVYWGVDSLQRRCRAGS